LPKRTLMVKAVENAIGREAAERVIKRLDVVGDIAIIKLPPELEAKAELIATSLLKMVKYVHVVLRYTHPTSGAYRVRGVEWLAGEKRTETLHKEYGCTFKVDLTKTFFTPRLSYERWRITRLIKPGETIINMFAGIGSFSIIAAKYKPDVEVFSIDINPEASRYAEENVKLNGVRRLVHVINGDAKSIIESSLVEAADRVLMPLPLKAYEYLEVALIALKPKGGWIHYHDFEHAYRDENPEDKVERKVRVKLNALKVEHRVEGRRIVRRVGPNWYHVSLDIRVEPKPRGLKLISGLHKDYYG